MYLLGNSTFSFGNASTATVLSAPNEYAISVSGDSFSACECKEYLYVNQPDEDAIHKFQIQADGTINEIGNPWYPGNGVSEMPSPHGLGTD